VFRRLTWFVIGIACGFWMAIRLMRFVGETMRDYSPLQATDDLARVGRQLGREIRSAVRVRTSA
jgi:hypothetical protein